jgi:putative transcriptional regulator
LQIKNPLVCQRGERKISYLDNLCQGNIDLAFVEDVRHISICKSISLFGNQSPVILDCPIRNFLVAFQVSDVMLAKRKMSVTELAEKVGITMANISVLKNGKAKAIRFSTLEAICKALECQPGDVLEYRK